MKKKHTHIEIQHVGPVVNCDICNEDYTDNNDDSGGFLFEGYAYCPKCAKTGYPRICGFKEDQYITAWCPSGKSYRQWVLDLRGGDKTIKIISQSEE